MAVGAYTMIYQTPCLRERTDALVLNKERLRVRVVGGANEQVSYSGLVAPSNWGISNWGCGFVVNTDRIKVFV